MGPNILPWVPESTARRGHAGCVASLEQYSIRWQAGGPVVTEPARHTTHCSPNINTERSQEEERRRRRSNRHFYVTKLPKFVSPMQESHHLAQIFWINFMPVWDPLSTQMSVRYPYSGGQRVTPGNAWHTKRNPSHGDKHGFRARVQVPDLR